MDLIGYEVLNGEEVAPGDVVTMLTRWSAVQPGSPDGITFLHLLSPQGAVVAGYDGSGAPPNRCIAGDLLVQVHRFGLPWDLKPAAYPIKLGWYERDTSARWAVELPGDREVDRLLLQPLMVRTRDE